MPIENISGYLCYTYLSFASKISPSPFNKGRWGIFIVLCVSPRHEGFGKYSDIEADKFLIVSELFKLINSKKVLAIVSLYSIQEIYSFCKRTFSPDDVGHVSRIALSILFKNEFALTGFLTREERLLNRAKFNMNDPSDQPHAISAFLNNCDAIVTYDEHFQKNIHEPSAHKGG